MLEQSRAESRFGVERTGHADHVAGGCCRGIAAGAEQPVHLATFANPAFREDGDRHLLADPPAERLVPRRFGVVDDRLEAVAERDELAPTGAAERRVVLPAERLVRPGALGILPRTMLMSQTTEVRTGTTAS
ncbi:hypothetical protein D8S78_01295 [Natrialba swarupiae]|nr:hypothetical protein [Natrialba swarupiae]